MYGDYVRLLNEATTQDSVDDVDDYAIKLENIIEKKRKLNGWEIDVDQYAGTLSFVKGNITVMATPLWEEDDLSGKAQSVITIVGDSDDSQSFVKVNYTGDLTKDTAMYLKAMTAKLKTIK